MLVWCGYFLNWGFFILGISGLYQGDQNQHSFIYFKTKHSSTCYVYIDLCLSFSVQVQVSDEAPTRREKVKSSFVIIYFVFVNIKLLRIRAMILFLKDGREIEQTAAL